MFLKSCIFLAVVAVALGKEYPPGVHPSVCPNYPICDAATLARFTLDGTPIPEWYYNPSILPRPPVDPHNPIPRYPAGADPFYPFYPYARWWLPLLN